MDFIYKDAKLFCCPKCNYCLSQLPETMKCPQCGRMFDTPICDCCGRLQDDCECKAEQETESKPLANDYWLNRIKKDGVKLLVEIDLSFEQFRTLLSDSIGERQSDENTLHFWEIANRRLLPPDPGSFSGIGFDINEIVRTATSHSVQEVQ